MSTKSYTSRAQTHSTAVGRKLLSIIAEKKTNLCLSIDVADPEEVLSIVEILAPKLCMVKTHIDTISFDLSIPNVIGSFTGKLSQLATKHNFLIFEDRKFADIGNTVKAQYTHGVYNIVSWAHITNAHTLPGEGIIKGLAEGAGEWTSAHPGNERGLVLLEEMSSAGNLFNEGGYRQKTIEMARRNREFVVGFIAMGAVGEIKAGEEDNFIAMTPGVNIEVLGDALGQQYKTPEVMVGEKGSDVIIVGRGIYKKKEGMVERAEEYRRRGWEAYERRLRGEVEQR
ncbi:Orotidine 5'-phosphate decarboxylase domain-containing protein [Kalaharituber pfeilii]|nr:Orotidine 5'-phosphate decarboxylase domain-containing protein [Kalaharituber pfeilii]